MLKKILILLPFSLNCSTFPDYWINLKDEVNTCHIHSSLYADYYNDKDLPAYYFERGKEKAYKEVLDMMLEIENNNH